MQEGNSSRGKYNHKSSLSLGMCVKIIEEYKSQNPPPKLYSLGMKYNVSRGQIRNIILNQESIIKAFKEAGECYNEFDAESVKLRERQDKLEILYMVVYEYLLRAVYHNEYESCQQLQIKATEIQKILDIKNFRASYLWLRDFQKVFNINDFSAKSLRANIKFNGVKSSRLDVEELLEYVNRRKMERATRTDQYESNMSGIKNPIFSQASNSTHRKRLKGGIPGQLSEDDEPKILYELSDDDEELANTIHAQPPFQCNDGDSDHINKCRLTDESVSTKVAEDGHQRDLEESSSTFVEIELEASCEDNKPGISNMINTSIVDNTENQAQQPDFNSNSIDTTIEFYGYNNSNHSNASANRNPEHNSIWSARLENQYLQTDEIIIKEEIFSPLHLTEDVSNPAEHAHPPSENCVDYDLIPNLSGDQVQIKIERPSTSIREDDAFIHDKASGSNHLQKNLTDLPQNHWENDNRNGNADEKMVIDMAATSTQFGEDIEPTFISNRDAVGLLNCNKESEHHSKPTGGKAQNTHSSLADMITLEEALRHLTVVEGYARLKKNYRAVDLAIQLDTVLKKKTPK